MGTPRRIVMVIAICLGIVLALIGFLTEDADRAAIPLAGSVAVMAGALIYLLATDDYQARKQIFGPEAADRRGERDAGDRGD
jgi:hypothetical protein